MAKDYVMFPLSEALEATPLKAVTGTEDGVRLTDKGTFIYSPDLEFTANVIHDFIQLHKIHRLPKLLESHLMYLGEHKIMFEGTCENTLLNMPDNRLVVNFAKYIVDTFNGYFIGVPVKVGNENESVSKSIQEFISRSDMNDNFAELAKISSIYGTGFLFMYQGEDAKTYATYNSPLDMFVIYDDSIQQTPIGAVRFWTEQRKGEQYTLGEFYRDGKRYIYSEATGGPQLEEDTEYQQVYPSIPIIEYVENDQRQSVFESVKSLINQFNKAMSEKANDVEYFANAYLKVLGAKVDNGTMTTMQANRVINAVGAGSQAVEIDFIQKPDADSTQENLLDRLTDLIFIISMVANTTDDTYGNASGTALEFKLQDMRNMAIAKERKFTSGMKNTFKLWSAIPLNSAGGKDSWIENTYTFTENIPRNVKEEIENAKNLEGIVSEETQMAQLSFVEDIGAEIKKKQEEADKAMEDFQKQAGMLGTEQVINDNQADSSTLSAPQAVTPPVTPKKKAPTGK